MAASVTEQSVMGVIRAGLPCATHMTRLSSLFTPLSSPPALSSMLLVPQPSPTTSSLPPQAEVGIDHWNEFDDSCAFVYSYPNISAKKILVKCLTLNDKLLIDALREGDSDKLLHLELDVRDYVAEGGGDNINNYASMFKNFGKLVRVSGSEIVGKFSGSSTASSSNQKPSSKSRGAPEGDLKQPIPLVSEPDDPYNINPLPQGYIVPPIPDMGYNDLFPGPGIGVYPTRGDYGGSGSMLLGPNDPRFFGMGEPGLPGGLQPGIPPSARFDPYGPPGVPGFDPNRFVRNPRRPGDDGGTHPDLEHFRDGSDII